MNNFNQRNKDISQIFDQRWNANKNNIKKVTESKKEFKLKMYGIKDKEDIRKEINEANTVNGRVERLNQKMAGLQNLNRNNFR